MEQAASNGFDTRVEIKDPKTGRIIRENHYKLTVHRNVQVYERAGKFYWPGSAEEVSKEEILKISPDFPFPTPEEADSNGLKTKKLDVKKLVS